MQGGEHLYEPTEYQYPAMAYPTPADRSVRGPSSSHQSESHKGGPPSPTGFPRPRSVVSSVASTVMRFDFFERRLSSLFRRYIKLVSRFPRVFMIVPFIITLILMFGFVKNPPLIRDELSLYTPTDAPARAESKLLKQYFDIDDNDPYYYMRRNEMERQGHIIITGHPEGVDVLTEPIMFDAGLLWEAITNVKITRDGSSYTYEQLCVLRDVSQTVNVTIKECIANQLVKQWLTMHRLDNGTHLSASDLLNDLRYPMTAGGLFIGTDLGGVTVDSKGKVTGARAIMLPYMLKHSNSQWDSLAAEWEETLTRSLNNYKSYRVKIAWWTSETLASESAKDRDSLLKLLIPLFIVLTSFTVGCCFVANWVRSRPWLGLGGVVSAGMAIVSSIGILLLVDYQFTSVAYSMPFIMFSIGVDNVFILLSAWRKTPTNQPLSKRMELSWSDAGVSITVTSLTDGLSFGVGCFATFPSVRVFCVYSTVAIIFVYLYQLTFFAGVMVLTGRREMDNKHCLTFRVVDDNVKAADPTVLRDVKLEKAPSTPYEQATQPTGAVLPDNSFQNNHLLAKFFRTRYADWLLNPVVRVLVITMFIVYLVIGAWGCAQLELGLRPTDLLPSDSHGQRALELQDKYFLEYSGFLHVMITNLTNLNYKSDIWDELDNECRLFQHTEFTGYSQSWSTFFKGFVNLAGYDLSPDNFIYILKNIFLIDPNYEKFSRDIVFDGTGTKLEAVRCMVHLRSVGVNNQSRAMHMLRGIAESSRMPVTVYSDFFQFAEQYDAVLPGTLMNIGLAGAAVILVSLLLIPKPDAALWVSMTIASINVGILGYMSLWGVRLDFVSMVTIVMSIGFCVDFSAHIAYTFSKEHGARVSDRLRESLYTVGTPILQSAASTILGVSFLVLLDSYVYRSFLKTVVLVVVLGAFHGLIILPVLLTMLSCNHGRSVSSAADYTSGGGSTSESEAAPTPPAHRRPIYMLPGLARVPMEMPMNGMGPVPMEMPGLARGPAHMLPVTANSFGLPPYHGAQYQHHGLDELPYAFPTAAVFER